MRIAHVSDIHIRNFKYRDEYRAAFEDLYRQLRDLQPDLVVNTGDTVHSKLAVSPELFDDVAEHMLAVSSIAPYWVILGNHDLNLRNPGRTDAISPIVRAIRGRTANEVVLLDDGPGWGPNCSYWWERGSDEASKDIWHYDIRGKRDPSQFRIDPERINIGLFHGSISGCVTDQGFVMEEGEVDLDRFEGMDFVLLGDIHKRQSFRGGRVQYPGSLIQQNYGEELVKGFLLWDIRGKDDFRVEFHEVRAPRRFYTIHVPIAAQSDTFALLPRDIPSGSRIKALVPGELSPSQRLGIERAVREQYDPIEVIIPDSAGERVRMEAPDVDSLVGSRDKLMLEHLRERGVQDPESVITLFHGYESTLDPDAVSRGTTWRLLRFEWDDMLNYGPGNHVDMTDLRGLVGIFAPNASGKSSIFDVLMQGLFDRITKDVPRNIDLVNDNKDRGEMRIWFESGGRQFHIERSIERIQYGQRRLAETRQWGRTSLDFSCEGESLNGTTRPETERAVRAVIGSFEDFALTAMVAQNPVFGLPGGADLINCKETDRRKILFRILDLDVYERVAVLARDDLKQAMARLKGDRDQLIAAVDAAIARLTQIALERAAKDAEISGVDLALEQVRVEIGGMQAAQHAIDGLEAARRKLRVSETALSAAEAKLIKAEDRVEDLEAEVLGLELKRPPEPAPEEPERAASVRTAAASTAKSLNQLRGERKAGAKALPILDQVPCGDSYPHCQFITGAYRFKQGLAELDRSIAALAAELASHEAAQRQLDENRRMRDGFESWRVSLAETHQQLAFARERVLACVSEHGECVGSWQRERDAVEALERSVDPKSSGTLRTLTDRKRSAEARLASLRTELEALLIRLGSARGQLEAAERELKEYDEVRHSVRELEELVELCGKNGLPYRILGLVLPLINAEIAKILAGVVGFGVFFEDDPEEQSVSLYIRYGDYRSRPLSLGSGAEKFIASLAVRVALLSVTSLPKTDMLIVDEGFGKLDPEHLESLQRMFEYLRGAFGTVFIISHVDFMRDIVDHSIEITGRDGYAHVEAS